MSDQASPPSQRPPLSQYYRTAVQTFETAHGSIGEQIRAGVGNEWLPQAAKELEKEAEFAVCRAAGAEDREQACEDVRYRWEGSPFRPDRLKPGQQPFDVGTNGPGQRQAQRLLVREGFMRPEAVDGSWGHGSRFAWRLYQASLVQPPQRVQYRPTNQAFQSLDTVPFQVGDMGGEVRNAQRALARAGFFPGVIDGKWGPQSQAHYEAYRAARGLLAQDGTIQGGI